MEIAINGIFILPLIIGLVEFFKKFGATGNIALANALVLGIIFGIAYQLTVAVPVDVSGWIAVVVYGLALGLSAAGLYDWSAKFRPQP